VADNCQNCISGFIRTGNIRIMERIIAALIRGLLRSGPLVEQRLISNSGRGIDDLAAAGLSHENGHRLVYVGKAWQAGSCLS